MVGRVVLSWWVLFAALGGFAVGQMSLFLRLRSVGGGVRSTLQAISDERMSYAIVVLIDSVTGLLTALVFGLVAPSAFVVTRFFGWSEPLGWIAIGSLGPWIADRGYSGSLLKGRLATFLPGVGATEDEIATESWRLRREAVDALRRSLWRVVRRSVSSEYIRLRTCVEEKLTNGDIDADIFVADVDDYIRVIRAGRRSAEVDRARRELPPYADRSLDEKTHRSTVIELACAMLDDQGWDVVEQYCGRIVGRRVVAARA